MERMFPDDLANCREITVARWARRPLWERAASWRAYLARRSARSPRADTPRPRRGVPPLRPMSEFRRFRGTDTLPHQRGPRGRRQLRARARAAAPRQGRARHRQDAARRGHRRGLRRRAHRLARQEHHPRPGRPLRLRHGAAPLRLALRRRRRQATSAGTSSSDPLGSAFNASSSASSLLIDEVDKADLEFPNDLLHELDRMRFRIAETGDEVVAAGAARR